MVRLNGSVSTAISTAGPEDAPEAEPATGAAPATPAGDGHVASLARGGAVNLLGALANAAFGLVLVVVVSWGMAPADRGLFFEAIAFVSIAAGVVGLGTDVGLIRQIPRTIIGAGWAGVGRLVRVALGPVAIAGLAVAAVVEVTAPWLSRLLTNGGDGLAAPLRILAPLLPVAAMSAALQAALRSFGRVTGQVVVDRIGRAASQPLLVGAALAAGLGTTAATVAWGAPVAVSAAVLLVMVLATVRRRARVYAAPAADASAAAGFWRFTAPRGLAGALAVTILWLDTLLLGAMRGPGDAGVYAAATRLLLLGSVVNVALMQVAGAQLGGLLAGRRRAEAAELYRTATCWLVALAWPAYLLLALFAPALLGMFGHGLGAGAVPLAILCAAMLVATACGPVDMVLLMTGRSSTNLANTAFALVLNISLNLVLIPRWGLMGAAVAWAVSIAANNVVPVMQVRRSTGMHPFGRGTVAAAAAALVCVGIPAAIVRVAMGPTVGGLAVALVVGGAAYGLALVRLRPLLGVAGLRSALAARRRPAAA